MNYTELKRLRIAKGLSLQEMAEAIGLKTAGGYLRIETGENKLDASLLPVIAKKFGIDLRELIETLFFDRKVEQSSSLEDKPA